MNRPITSDISSVLTSRHVTNGNYENIVHDMLMARDRHFTIMTLEGVTFNRSDVYQLIQDGSTYKLLVRGHWDRQSCPSTFQHIGMRIRAVGIDDHELTIYSTWKPRADNPVHLDLELIERLFKKLKE